MGMSTHVIGFRPPDEKWRKMKAIWDGCKEAEVDVPEEVGKFFGWEEPDERGIKVELGCSVQEWDDDAREGFEVDLSKVPEHVTHIRFYNSW